MKTLITPRALVLADQAIFSGTSFLLTILLARSLCVADFGKYSAIVLVAYLAISAIGAWTTQVFQVSSDRSKEYISFVFISQVMLTGIVALGFNLISSILSVQVTYTALLFGVGFVLYDFCRKILLALDHIAFTLALDVVASVLVLVGFGMFFYSGSKDMHEILSYFSLAYFIAFLITLLIVRPFAFSYKASKSFAEQHIKEGKWLFLTALSQWWAGNLFIVASGVYLGAAALGALRLGQSLFGVLNILLQTFENYVLPQTAIKMKESQSNGISYLKEMNQKLGYVFVPVLLFIFAFATAIIKFVGGMEYTEYSFVLQGLCVLYIFIFLSQPIRFFVRSMQMNQHFFYAYLISLIFAIITSKALIASFGLYGVITGLIASQIILMTYWIIVLQIKNINLWKSSTSY